MTDVNDTKAEKKDGHTKENKEKQQKQQNNYVGEDDGRETKNGTDNDNDAAVFAKEDDQNNSVPPGPDGVLNLDDSLVDDLRCCTNQNTNNNKTRKRVNVRASHLQDVLIIDDDNMSRSASGVKAKRNTSGISFKETERFHSSRDRFQTLLLGEEIQIRNQVQTSPGFAQGTGGLCNVVGTSIINVLSSFLVFALFLVSLESLLSIGLSVAFTICKF
jgi:hypothetical protein